MNDDVINQCTTHALRIENLTKLALDQVESVVGGPGEARAERGELLQTLLSEIQEKAAHTFHMLHNLEVQA